MQDLNADLEAPTYPLLAMRHALCASRSLQDKKGMHLLDLGCMPFLG
jgi:hypothetical protein